MKRLIALIGLMLIGLLATACGGSSATPTTASTSAPTDAPPTAEVSDTTENTGTDISALLPASPAGADEWRYDSAQVVAQTGRPQLIEKWAED